MDPTIPITETTNYIILDQYERLPQLDGSYQSEAQLEEELISDLQRQGYEYAPEIRTPEALLKNVRAQIERLNKISFTDEEWVRFCTEFVDSPGDSATKKAKKVHESPVCDFKFDDGRVDNILLFDKRNLSRNQVQVINQMEQTGSHTNRYDVTILINGLPLVHIELKRRGVAIREAFNQIHRYSKESFNGEASLYKYIQLFVISNGTDTRYFANTTKRDKNSFDFTMNWAQADNTPIKDLKDFTATFLQKETLLKVILIYSVLDVTDTLLVMRPYQIAATERILWKIRSSFGGKKGPDSRKGGYIWHTTGSGKTLTSFKAARLATELNFIDKVFFVVDRKDLDYQTMKEYQRFSPDSVNGSESTVGLKRNIERKDNKIIVTTIQKLTRLMKTEPDLEIYQRQVVFIFDEAHRSQFGEGQHLLSKLFKKYCQFGFTGTPIFTENALDDRTTADIFGRELHKYVITDAIRDEKVLKFKVDYNDVRPRFKQIEQEQDELKLSSAEYRKALLHPERIREITSYILENFARKTHRTLGNHGGFNAMFAVSSVEAAKLYYEEFRRQQEGLSKRLRVATIFSFAPNEEQSQAGEVSEENFEPEAMDLTSKEFLQRAIGDYNQMYQTNYSIDSSSFQNYYRDLAQRMRDQQVDLLIVVGMFLTGFDAPRLNTLFVDKNLRYHGLIQAFSRTNRIYDSTKSFGNIVCFRDLEQATIDAITLFGDQHTRGVILEHSYDSYLKGFVHELTGEQIHGYIEVVKELQERFPDPSTITTDGEKRAFVKLFGQYLRLENILQNFDEFVARKELDKIPEEDHEARTALQDKYGLTREEMEELQRQPILSERAGQDYRSTYNDIRESLRHREPKSTPEESALDWDDIIFEVDLLKSQEINLDYILELVFDHLKKMQDKEALIDEIRRIIRASIDQRAKEGLIVDFIHQLDLETVETKADLMEAFYTYAREVQQREVNALITEEHLNEEGARRYIQISLEQEFASENGTDLKEILPKMSSINKQYTPMKQRVLEKIKSLVEKFRGIGYQTKMTE